MGLEKRILFFQAAPLSVRFTWPLACKEREKERARLWYRRRRRAPRKEQQRRRERATELALNEK